MAHGLICGMTLSGKTTLAKMLCQQLKSTGVQSIVLDPLLDPEWQSEMITDSQQQFLEWYWSSRQCVAFIDESGESVGRFSEAMTKTATKGRHWGHMNFYIMQEPTQIAPLIRAQCTRLYMFCSAAKEGERMAAEFNYPELLECTTLRKGEFFKAVKFGGISRQRAF